MRSSRLRYLAAAAAPLVFLVAACGQGDGTDETALTSPDDAAATSLGPQTDLAEVAVDGAGEEPTLTWDGSPFADGPLPFVSNETQVEQVAAGDGDEVAEGDEVDVRYLAVNGTSGEEIVSTFAEDAVVTLELANETLFPAFRDNLPGTQVGETLLMALPADEAFGPMGSPQLGVGPEDTLVFYLEVDATGAPLTQAEGQEVEPQAGLPTVEADGQSAAQIDVEGVEPPGALVVQPLIEGERKQVQPGMRVRVHYTGVQLSNGEQFDSSYDRDEPFEFQVGAGNVIQGWDEGLIGQNVGSRVLLVIPAEQAYGVAQEDGDEAAATDDAAATATAEPTPEPHALQGEDLVFVVDILGAY